MNIHYLKLNDNEAGLVYAALMFSITRLENDLSVEDINTMRDLSVRLVSLKLEGQANAE